MNNGNSVIYGLEYEARTLSAQNGETDIVRFLVGTQTVQFTNNQIHLVELNDDTNTVRTQIYHHEIGEIWSLQSSPTDPEKFITSYNTIDEKGIDVMKGALWGLPIPEEYTTDILNLDKISDIDTTPYGKWLKTIVYHPMEGTKAVAVVNNNFVLWHLNEGNPQVSTVGTLPGKNEPQFVTGKWNPHNGCNQFVTADGSNVRGWDFRSPMDEVWAIKSAHSQIVKDLDFNPNKQYYMATCGNDGCMKFWDIRSTTKPILSRMEHSHWVWNIKINRFHDQLVLTSSSDSRVILSSIPSVSSEPYGPAANIIDDENDDDSLPLEEALSKNKLDDGVIAKYEEHETSVYAIEWSSADPWTFASLSYNGRLIINKVPRKYKYKILL